MSEEASGSLDELVQELAGEEPAQVERAVDALGNRLSSLSGDAYRRAVEALCSLFYIDTADRPDLDTALEKASDALGTEGVRVVPLLISQMEGSDIKSHLLLARTLGRIGREAIPKLRDVLATAEDPYSRSFVLYALGKMACPEVSEALPEAIGSLMHPDKEVRDSAARTVGKIARAVPASILTERRRREMFEALLRAVRDSQPAVRAKAMRSLGKMAEANLLDQQQKAAVIRAARVALGEAGNYVWDAAFIVRREAREALRLAETRSGD